MKFISAISLLTVAIANPTRFLSQSADAKLDPTSSFLAEDDLTHKRAEEAHARAQASKEKYLAAMRKLSADKALFDKEGHDYAQKAEEEQKEADSFARKLSIIG